MAKKRKTFVARHYEKPKRTKYQQSEEDQKRLRKAIQKYNRAVIDARTKAGFGKYELDGLAMPTTYANVSRRVTNKKELNRVINNLMEYTKKGGTDLDFKVDESTGEVIDIRFRAQTKQLNRAVAAENKIREQARTSAKAGDERIYNPNIDVDLKEATIQDIKKRRGTSPIDLATTTSIIHARTTNWKINYVNKLEESLQEAQKVQGILQSDIDKIRKLERNILNASIGQINYMIYNERRGDIRSGPYPETILLYLDSLIDEWDRAFSNPWDAFGG